MDKKTLVAEGTAASYDPDDIAKTQTGSLEERQAALMRLIAVSYKRGWDDCYAAMTEVIAAQYETTAC